MTEEKFYVNDTYILKKDLPTVKKGVEFVIKDDEHGVLYILAVNQISFCLKGLDDFDEWFEKMENKKNNGFEPYIPNECPFRKHEFCPNCGSPTKFIEKAFRYGCTNKNCGAYYSLE